MQFSFLKSTFNVWILSVCIVATGCVSSSLDDVGLDANNEPVSQQTTSINQSIAAAPQEQPQDLTALRSGSQVELDANQAAIETLPIATNVQSSPAEQESVNEGASNSFNEISDEQRQQGIEEIRAKANALPNQKPNVNASRTPATIQFTKEEQKLKLAELQAEALAAQGEISDDELRLRKLRIAKLRRDASNHYNRALKQISK